MHYICPSRASALLCLKDLKGPIRGGGSRGSIAAGQPHSGLAERWRGAGRLATAAPAGATWFLHSTLAAVLVAVAILAVVATLTEDYALEVVRAVQPITRFA
ncbi:hypothetical protein Misp02_23630 [Microtetraspora sp. NBRC 16547]|nr:hypothetical protein Misp02_23630 [Microtetraspora sp. NBRC 16547]